MLALVLAFIMTWIRKAAISHVSDYETGDFEPNLLLLVRRGRVIEYGEAVWRGKGKVYAVDTRDWRTDINVKRTPGSRNAWLSIELDVNKDEHGPYEYLPQQLYDHVVKRGFREVSRFITVEFREQVLKTKLIEAVLERYQLVAPSVFAAHLKKALKKAKFKLPFSNIKSVRVEIDFIEPTLYNTYRQ